MRTRAERRHFRRWAVAYARKKLKQWGINPKHAPLWADNMAKCSCAACSAPHKKPEIKDVDTSYEDEFDWGI